jgi:glycine cleavage system H lipoate-binding protein
VIDPIYRGVYIVVGLVRKHDSISHTRKHRYAPVDGAVVEVNAKLEENPGLVNTAALSEGWFIKIKVNDVEQVKALLDAKAYEALCESEQ